jgi:hypothetical protein
VKKCIGGQCIGPKRIDRQSIADYYPKGKVYRRRRIVIAQKQMHLKALSNEADFGTKSCMIRLATFKIITTFQIFKPSNFKVGDISR